MPPLTTRPLTDDDVDTSLALSAEAFGPPPTGQPRGPLLTPGRHPWGTFDGERLVARVTAREYHAWWHGQQVPTTGIASVAVAAEHRGAGLLGGLFHEVLSEARARGEVLSTLYPTAPGIYRRLGYELVTSLDHVEVPTLALTRIRPSPGIGLRRAEPADLPAVRAVYDRWAAAQHGPLTRRGISFPATDDEVLDGLTGMTLALDEDDANAVVGYLTWARGPGYDSRSWVEAVDLVAVDGRAYPSLWHLLGSFASVTGSVRWRTSGTDAAARHLPGDLGRVVETHPYMLRVDDVAAAIGLTAPQGDVDLAVSGDVLGRMDGTYRVADGRCRRTDPEVRPGLPTFAPRGLALAYAGLESAAGLRLAGLLTGPDRHDAVIDGWWGRAAMHVRDYF